MQRAHSGCVFWQLSLKSETILLRVFMAPIAESNPRSGTFFLNIPNLRGYRPLEHVRLSTPGQTIRKTAGSYRRCSIVRGALLGKPHL